MNHNDKKSAVFKQIRYNLGLTQSAMAKYLNMSVRNYQAYEWGKFDDSTSSKSEKALADVLSLITTTKKGEKIYEEVLPSVSVFNESMVPVYDLNAQGSNVTSFDDDLSELPKSFVQVPGFEDCTFAVYVWNHSMYPTYENGCMVIVKKINNLKAIQYGSSYLIITDEQRVVKRVYEDEEDPTFVLLASDNPETRKDNKPKYPSYKVAKVNIKQLFLVKGVIKRTEI